MKFLNSLKFAILLTVLTLTSCASMFLASIGAEAEPPANQNSSMAVLELIAFTGSDTGTEDSRSYSNDFFSGWYPIVKGPDGNEVRFSNVDAISTAGFLYFSENVMAGEYIIEGFRYIWMTHYDFMHTPIKDLKFYGWEKHNWTQWNYYELPEPVSVEIQPGTMCSLGRYRLFFETRDDGGEERYNLKEFRYESIEPENKNGLRAMKPWAAGPWVEWNKRNNERPLDD